MENKSARTILSENLQTLMKNNNIDQMELAEANGLSTYHNGYVIKFEALQVFEHHNWE